MTARSVLRGLGYMLKEVEAFVPWQAWRCALGTDFAWRQSQAAYAHDAGLTAFEEANEVHEPRAQCKWCGNVDSLGHDCGRKYHTDLSPVASARPGGSGEGDCGIPPPPPSPPLSFTAWADPAIRTILDAHEHRSGYMTDCVCGAPGIFSWLDWVDHVSPLIAEHLDQALAADGQHVIVTNIYPAMESGQDMGASMACEFFPQYQKK